MEPPHDTERLRTLIARWFVVYALLALPVAGWVAVSLFGIDPGAGGNICTGPLALVFDIGVIVFGGLFAAGLTWSGLLHGIAGWKYLRRDRAGLIHRVCWLDAGLWLVVALSVGPGLGWVLLATCIVLCNLHIWAGVLFRERTSPAVAGTFRRAA